MPNPTDWLCADAARARPGRPNANSPPSCPTASPNRLTAGTRRQDLQLAPVRPRGLDPGHACATATSGASGPLLDNGRYVCVPRVPQPPGVRFCGEYLRATIRAGRETPDDPSLAETQAAVDGTESEKRSSGSLPAAIVFRAAVRLGSGVASDRVRRPYRLVGRRLRRVS